MFCSRLLTFVTIVSVAASASAATVTSASTHFQVDCVKQSASASGVHTECHVDGHIRTDADVTKLTAAVPNLLKACSCLAGEKLPLAQDKDALAVLGLNGEDDQEFLSLKESLVLGVDAVAKTNANTVMQTRRIWEQEACQDFRGPADRVDVVVLQAGAQLVVYNHRDCTGLNNR